MRRRPKRRHLVISKAERERGNTCEREAEGEIERVCEFSREGEKVRESVCCAR